MKLLMGPPTFSVYQSSIPRRRFTNLSIISFLTHGIGTLGTCHEPWSEVRSRNIKSPSLSLLPHWTQEEGINTRMWSVCILRLLWLQRLRPRLAAISDYLSPESDTNGMRAAHTRHRKGLGCPFVHISTNMGISTAKSVICGLENRISVAWKCTMYKH
jgi:hypothetical protein